MSFSTRSVSVLPQKCLIQSTKTLFYSLQVFQLEQHCRNLEGELESVKEGIMKILSDKSSTSRENESLRQAASAYDELREENERLRRELEGRQKTDPPKSPALSTSSKGSSSNSSTSTDPTGNADRSSPDGQEFEDETTSSSASGPSCR